MKQFRNRLASEWLALALGLGLLVGAAGWSGWLSRLDLVFYDVALASWRRPAPDDIVIIAADEASLAAIGRWPWRRAVHGTLLDRLTAGGARVVGLDILLDEADQADGASDAALAKAMEQNGRVVLPVTQGPGEGGGAEAIRPIPAFASRAAALGFADVRLDADGIARSVWLAEGAGRAETPHFAYAVLQVADPRHFPLQIPLPESVGTWQRAWPMFIPYAGPPGHFHTVSYVDVLLGKVPAETFRDKLVLVGVTAAGIGDNNPVPTSGNGRVMAGVEISANVIDALRRDVAIRSLPAPMAGGVGALMVLGLLAFLRRTSPRNGLLLSLGCGVALIAFSALLLRLGQAWFPPAAALAGCALAYPLWSWRRLEAAQRYLDEELGLLAADSGILPGVPPQPGPSGKDAIEQRIDVVRMAAERQRDARRFLADALESLPGGMLVADRTGKVVLANRRAAALLDLRPGRDPLGVPLAELLARLKPVGGQGGDARLGGAADSWGALKMEVSSGAASNLLLDVAPCRGDGGRYLGLVASLTDVAELRAAQKSRDESMRFLSHDLRSPLTTIVTLLAAAEDDPPDAGAQAVLLDRIGSYARRSLALADDMLRLGRAEAIDPNSFLELDLRSVLEEAVDEVWPVARARGIELAAELPGAETEALVRGDGEMLRRAFVNLLTNAVKYSDSATRIALGLSRDGGGWRVSVADQGRGMAPDQVPRLFTRYGRFPASQDYVEGIGLGLVIVKAVIDAHGGSIEVDSEPGRGTTFLVSLPGIVPG